MGYCWCYTGHRFNFANGFCCAYKLRASIKASNGENVLLGDVGEVVQKIYNTRGYLGYHINRYCISIEL